MVNLKQKVLNATDGGRLIFERLYPESRSIFSKEGKGHIKIRDEKTASASFKKISSSDGDYWIITDFGSDTTMNAIDAYMKENGIQFFKEAIYKLAQEFNVSYALDPSVNKARIKQRPATTEDKAGEVVTKPKPITKSELEVMGATVTEEIMEKYHYLALESYSTCKDGKVTTFTSTEDYPIFMHDCGSFKKIYKPLETNKAYRFFYIGQKPLNYINGLEEAQAELKSRIEDAKALPNDEPIEKRYKTCGLTENGKLPMIVICSGERDAMCLAGMGYYPIWFNSETAKKTNNELNQLFKIAERVYNVPDKDDTGILMGRTLALDHIDIFTIELPEWLNTYKDARMRPCKDLRDYIELRPSKDEFEKLIQSAQCAKFWDWSKDKKNKVEIRALSLLYFLKLNGFHKYKDPITHEIKLIRIQGYTVSEYDPVQIRDFVRQELKNRQAGNLVMEAYISSRKTTKALYDDLDTIEIDFEGSTNDSRTLFFKNVCCTVTRFTGNEDNKEDYKVEEDGIATYKQPSNGKYIWESKIIPHNFKRLKPSFLYDFANGEIEIHLENNPSKFLRFMINTSRIYWREEYEQYETGLSDANEIAKDAQTYYQENMFNIAGPRLANVTDAIYLQKLTLINKIYAMGYLMHQHKIAANAKAIWAMEYKNNEEGQSNGRSGKSLMIDSLQRLGLSEIVTLEGRSKKLTDNNHFMDRVSESTDIVHVDDAGQGFDFDTFYTMITGSITINPKNEKSFELRYEDAPNIVFTSNFPIPNTDASTLARILFLAFSDYYHAMTEDSDYHEERKVSTELGNLYDDQYGEDMYNADINVLLDCLQFYLNCVHYNMPAIQPPLDSIIKRAKRKQMGEPFLNWAKEFYDPEGDNVNCPIIRQAAYDDYCEACNRKGDVKSPISWMKALKNFVKYDDRFECLNPNSHPWKHNDGRITATQTYKNREKTYEMVYVQTKGGDPNNTVVKLL